MKVIGIVGRAYYNRDEGKIIQINEYIRKIFASYEDVVTIALLPTNDSIYPDLKMGEDEITRVDKQKLDTMLSLCDAFVIPGGSYWYQFDEYVIQYAIKNKRPFLAICLGFQAFCSMYAEKRDRFDMTLRLENNDHHGDAFQYKHIVAIKENTKLFQILGQNKISVNSVHHDYVSFPMDTLRVSAVSEDSIIEAVELVDHPFAIGLQWHPEYLQDDASRRIFDAFIESI